MAINNGDDHPSGAELLAKSLNTSAASAQGLSNALSAFKAIVKSHLPPGVMEVVSPGIGGLLDTADPVVEQQIKMEVAANLAKSIDDSSLHVPIQHGASMASFSFPVWDHAHSQHNVATKSGVFLQHNSDLGYYPLVDRLEYFQDAMTMNLLVEAHLSSGVVVSGRASKGVLESLKITPQSVKENPEHLALLLRAISLPNSCSIRVSSGEAHDLETYTLLLGGPANGELRPMPSALIRVAPLLPMAFHTPSDQVEQSTSTLFSVYHSEKIAIGINGFQHMARVAVDSTVPKDSIFDLFEAAMEEFPFPRFLPQYAPFWKWSDFKFC